MFFTRKISSVEATAATAAAVVRRNNFAVVRGALDAATADECRAFAERKLVASGDPGNNLLHLISDNGQTDFGLVRSILTPAVVSVASEYFAAVAGTSDFILPYMNLQIRQYDAGRARQDTIIPFHQDAFAFPKGIAMLNCWTLMYPEECGETSPGLDFMPRVFRALVEREVNAPGVYGFLQTSAAKLSRVRDEPVTPSVRLGDVVMFNELALHRTSLKAGLSKSRVSAEVRVLAATRQALEYHDILAESFAIVKGGSITWPDRWRLSEDGKFRTISTAEAPLIRSPIRQ